MKKFARHACGVLLLAGIAGCTHIGPPSVAVDRFDYSTAIADSWKQQTLLNIVKIRYMDLPVFVDVSSVVAGYSIQTGVTVTGQLSSERAIQGNFGSLSAQGIYTDRPTITYTPMTGDKFMRALITPIEPRNLFFFVQAGYPADFVLGLSVQSLNGVRNRSVLGGVVRNADPDFTRALALMRDVQAAGGVGLRVEERKDKGPTTVMFFRRADLPPDVLEKAAEVRRLLSMPPDQERFTLVFSPLRGAPGEFSVNSRSMLQVLTAFASYVDVPDEHLKMGLAPPSLNDEGDRTVGRIRSGTDRPENAFAAVRYHGRWFWIDGSDFAAKRALTAVMFFFTMAETGSPERLPLVTIPAQ
jgi:hypothetical protein